MSKSSQNHIKYVESSADFFSCLETPGCSFFTSPDWLSCWQDCLPEKFQPELYADNSEGDNFAWGFLIKRGIKRHKLISSRSAFLNCTGDPDYDVLGLEKNSWNQIQTETGLYCSQFLTTIFSNEYHLEELHLSGIRENSPFLKTALLTGNNLSLRIQKEDTAWHVNFSLFEDRESYINLLGPKVRRNLRKALRKWENTGEIKLQEAESLEEARSWMKELSRLHQLRWEGKNETGAFGRPFFCKFHNKLISRLFSSGKIQILKITAGSTVIGYLYNFIFNNQVISYQGGFNYDFPKLSPGMICHLLAISHNKEKGISSYDFLTGSQSYKKEMATASDKYFWVVIYKRKTKFVIENYLRLLKRKIKGNLFR